MARRDKFGASWKCPPRRGAKNLHTGVCNREVTMSWTEGSAARPARSRSAGFRGVSSMWWKQVSRAGAVVVVAACWSGCRAQSLPPAPPVLRDGVAIYSDINYDGASAFVTADIADLRAFDSVCSEVDTLNDARFTAGSHTWTNCISSVGVAAGWRAILFSDPGFAGERVELSDSIRDLRRLRGPCQGTLNDCVSSIKVVRAPASE
jgi:hypothetical protein